VQIRLNANVEEEQAKRLKHALVDEGISFSEWLRQQIDQYIEAKEPKRKRRKGKEG
jgi:predicted nucleic acid-binding Zn ribbon protein